MTDLEITKLCAEAMGIAPDASLVRSVNYDYALAHMGYNPLKDDAQSGAPAGEGAAATTKPQRGAAGARQRAEQQQQQSQQSQRKPVAVEYAKLKERISNAKDIDTLDLDADLIRELDSPKEQDELRDLHKKKRDELQAAAYEK